MADIDRRTVLAGLAAVAVPLPSATAADLVTKVRPRKAIPIVTSTMRVDTPFWQMTHRQIMELAGHWTEAELPGWGLAPGFVGVLEANGDGEVGLVYIVEAAKLDTVGCHSDYHPSDAIYSRLLWPIDPTGAASEPATP